MRGRMCRTPGYLAVLGLLVLSATGCSSHGGSGQSAPRALAQPTASSATTGAGTTSTSVLTAVGTTDRAITPSPTSPTGGTTTGGATRTGAGNTVTASAWHVGLGRNASLGGRLPFPVTNPWNTRIDSAPIDPNSARLIASIGAGGHLHPDFGADWDGGPFGIPYVVVGGTQKKVPVSFDYADESDRGPYPVPANAPVEPGSDAHVLVLDRDAWRLYEMWDAAPSNGGARWHAGSGAVFDLSTGKLRPAGWTSADAAGLPIFPGLVRYDEVAAGEIRHALRFTVSRSRKGYVSPARHSAGASTDSSLPPMGMRVRLKSSFNISSYPRSARVVLTALKRYGMIVADNGSNWYLSGTADARWDDDAMNSLKRVPGSAFEVVRMGKVTTG